VLKLTQEFYTITFLLLAVAPGRGHPVAVPITFVFNLFLDRFISGFTMGAVKG
jgi:hypothetical protein